MPLTVVKKNAVTVEELEQIVAEKQRVVDEKISKIGEWLQTLNNYSEKFAG